MPAITLPNLSYVDIPSGTTDPVANWLMVNFPADCELNFTTPRLTEMQRTGVPTLAVIRNPWMRLLDAYTDLSTRRQRLVIPQGLGTTPANSYFDLDYLEFLQQFEGHADFNSWVKILPDMKSWKTDWFALNTTQSIWIDAENIDYLFRYETLATDFQQIQDLLNCDAEFLAPKPTVYQHHYDAEARKLVATWFAVDIERWEYKF